MQRRIFVFIALWCCLFTVKAESSIRVGMEADDIVTRTLFDQISEHFQIPVEYIYYQSFNDILTAVESGESDFAANVTYTDERASRFDFSSPTNIEYTYLFSATGKKLTEIDTVGVPKGTIYGALIAKNFPLIEQIEYNGQLEAKALMKSRRVDGVVDAINQLKPMLLAGYDAYLLNHRVSIKPVSLIATKGKHQANLDRFEALIHQAKVQKALRESISQYQFDLRQQALRIMVNQSGIDQSRPLTIKIEPAGHYAYYLTNGQLGGMTPDVVFSACNILQVNCQLVSHKDEQWESMYDDVLAQRIDMVSPIAISEQRKNVAYFSKPYFTSQAIVVKREGYKEGVYSNVSELIGERIGVIKNDIYHELLLDLLPQKKLYTYGTNAERVNALLKNEIDYIVINRTSFNKVLRDAKQLLPLEEDTLIGAFYSTDVAIGFARNQRGKTLAALFSQAITMLDLEKIVGKHDVLPDWKATLKSEQRLARMTLSLIVLVLIASLTLSFYLNHQSNTDNLTKLKNRRALQRRYSKGVAPCETLVYLDVNKFKPINDTYGHDIGDQVLKEIALSILRYWPGQSYRIGGDEFILAGTVSNIELSHAILHLKTIKFTSENNRCALQISLAFGVSKSRTDWMSLDEVMHEADLSMYANKRKERLMDSQSLNEAEEVSLGIS